MTSIVTSPAEAHQLKPPCRQVKEVLVAPIQHTLTPLQDALTAEMPAPSSLSLFLWRG